MKDLRYLLLPSIDEDEKSWGKLNQQVSKGKCGTLLARMLTVPWFADKSVDKTHGGSLNCTVIESIVFPGSFLSPTIRLIRHVPVPEVSCGFTYIGTLFNFLTLYEGKEKGNLNYACIHARYFSFQRKGRKGEMRPRMDNTIISLVPYTCNSLT